MSQLSFACRHRYADGFELDVAFETAATVTALFGPSGSGKTSILQLIAGLVDPQSAKVVLDGTVLCDTAAGQVLPPSGRHVGCVFQDYLLFPHLTVEANLRYGWQRRGRDQQQVDFDRAVAVLELAPLLGRYPRNLSGGEGQRVALGRAIVSGPRLLLLDEPLAALDSALKTRILGYLERVIGEWGIPTLFVTHGQAEVRRLAEQVVVLQQGRLLTSGSPEVALAQPGALALRNSAAPANLLRIVERSLEQGHWVGQIGSQRLQLPQGLATSGEPIYLQCWPNEVTLAAHDVSGVSVRNHLRGTVRQMIELPDRTFVAVDVGQILWSEITRDAARELDLAIGRELFCLIKTQSLRAVE